MLNLDPVFVQLRHNVLNRRHQAVGRGVSGVPEPTAVLDTHAAAAGIAIVTGQLGASVGTAAIVAEWSRASLLRVPLHQSGSGYRGAAKPFLTGIQNPVAVILTKAGDLLAGDWKTGKIYEITR